MEEDWYPRVIVIGHGGIKAFKILGFLCPVEDFGLLQYIDTYCGVSIGAVISLLIVCGYEVRDIIGFGTKLDIFRELINFDSKTFASNEPLRKLLINLVVNKFGNVPTLYSLYMMTGKALITTTLNITDEISVMQGPFTHPDISCVDAVMFSMNIPFHFYQLTYQGKTYVDGTLANSYPTDYFDDNNTNILGIYTKVRTTQDNTLTNYYVKIINCMTDRHRNNVVSQSSDKCKHISLEAVLSQEESIVTKAEMLVEGYKIGNTFLSSLKRNNSKITISPKQKYKYPEYFL